MGPRARRSFLGELRNLERTDPAKAKQVLGEIAGKLRSVASPGDPDARQLAALADNIQKAAETGDLAELKTSALDDEDGDLGAFAGRHVH